MKAPEDLQVDGRALHQRISEWLAEENVALDPHEEVVLVEACRVADRLALLRAAIAGRDLVEGGVVRLLAEERQQRVALANLLVTKLGFPTGLVGDEDTSVGASPRSRRAQKAAQSRWQREARGAS